jgi:hypothetical protein
MMDSTGNCIVFRQYKQLLFVLIVLISCHPISGQINFSYHSNYSYLKGKDAASLGASWMNPGFEASAWTTGNAPFRYGDGTSGVELTDMINNYSTIYLRSAFECSAKDLIDKLVMNIDYDDGFVVWINGVKAMSMNSPADLKYNSFAPGNHESGTGEVFKVDAFPLNLVDGINIVAVQCFNVSLSSTDFYFDMSITAESNLPELPGNSAINFSVKSGFFTNPFSVIITSAEPSSSIIYTLDGSNPQNSTSSYTSGSPVTIPIDPASPLGRPVTPSVIVRASITKPGFKPSKPVARTYIFIEKVKNQSWPGGGWPSSNINGQIIDLDIDQRVVTNPAYSGVFNSSLVDIPSVSIITDLKNLFDPASGIYVNADGHGFNWEKECSVEMIQPDGTSGFNINAGLRIRGGWSRGEGFPKHGFRLFFREEYGSDKLYFPLFGEEGADQFDKIDLRCEQNYGWNNGMVNNSFVREVFSRDTQRDMGQPYTRSRYYHLYLNGMYWGLYQSQERSEARYAASYLDGEEEEFDVIKVNTENSQYSLEATDGNLDSWQKLWTLCNTGFSSNSNYYALEGKDQDGKPLKGGEVLVDIDNLIDYMLVIFYTGNFDAPTASFMKNKGINNFYAIDNREDKSKGFIFFTHDAEHTLFDEPHPPGVGLTENRVNIASRTDDMRMEVSGFTKFHPQWLHYKLTANKEYLTRFKDRAYNHFKPGGVFSAESSLIRINKRIEEVELAVVAESARWGDAKRGTGNAYTKNDQWIPEVNKIRNVFIPKRPDIVIKQLMNEGLYPAIKAPGINGPEGIITGTDVILNTPLQVDITNPNSSGTIYYTLDGLDPRKTGNGIYPAAQFCIDNAKLAIIESTILKARILANGNWSALSQVSFLKKQEDYSNLKVTELHYHPPDYIVGYDTTSGKDLEFIEFKNTGINSINLSGLELDSAVHYHFPENVLLPPKQFFVMTSKPSHFFDFYGMIASGNFQGNFSNSGEEVLLKDANGNKLIDFIYDDASPWSSLADGKGYSLSSAEIDPVGNPANISYWTTSIVKYGTPFADNSVNPNPPDQVSEGSLLVYPNPTKRIITIQLVTEEDLILLNISLYNVTGKRVYSSVIGNPGLLDLNSLGLAGGIYFLDVSSKGISARSRIIFVK